MESEFNDTINELFAMFGNAQSLPVDHPNTDFNAANEGGSKYLKLYIMPVSSDIVTKGSAYSRTWNVQASIYVRSDTGDGGASAIVDALRTEFPAGRRVTSDNYSFVVQTDAIPAPPIPMDGWFSTPVTFRFQSSQ